MSPVCRVALLTMLAWALIGAIVLCASRAFALDYELWHQRPGSDLRTDEPNIRRAGQIFASHQDCLEAIALSRAEKGWRLRCRPVERAPVPSLKAAK